LDVVEIGCRKEEERNNEISDRQIRDQAKVRNKPKERKIE
jgi:hypothetical protein